MALIRVKTKYQLTLPTVVHEKAGVSIGDVLEAKVENGKITLTPKSLVDRHVAESLQDFKSGRYYGPFDSAEDMIGSLNRRRGKTLKKTSRSKK